MKHLVNPIDKFVGSRIRLQRKILSIDETTFADALGLPMETLQKYESGLIRVDAENLQKITNILNVSPAYFFDGLSIHARLHHAA